MQPNTHFLQSRGPYPARSSPWQLHSHQANLLTTVSFSFLNSLTFFFSCLALSLFVNAGPVVDISCTSKQQITKGGQSQQMRDMGKRERTLPLFRIRSKTSVSQRDERWTGGTLAPRQWRAVSRTRCIL